MMEEVIVRNEDIKEILNDMLWFYEHREDLIDIKADCVEHADERDYLVSDEYCKIIRDAGSAHNGFPEKLYGYNLRAMDADRGSRRLPEEWLSKWNVLNERLMQQLAVRNVAVATLYPPGGYIAWHNNANANGFNILFTWSETGEGSFDYIDENGERVVLKDKANEWVCRYGHFGKYHQDKYPIVYHAADTDCWRITVAFVFNSSETAGGLQEFIIEEIENP